MKLVNSFIFLLIIAAVVFDSECSFIAAVSQLNSFRHDTDPGDPLFLTPLLNNKSLPKEEVRKMARVVGKQFLRVESYAGYLTVDEAYNSSLFFWYFPAEQDADNAPVLLWLQGGPGASSLIGLFLENGPFRVVNKKKLQKRKYSWTTTHNVIFIDNPVGTGFSFTDDDKGYARNEHDVGENLYEAIVQLYKLFDWSNSPGFWVTGESYAGKYVPALAYHIHQAQACEDHQDNIPLKGMIIGNGLSDPLNQLKYGDYLYQLGLIDENGLAEFHLAEAAGEDCITRGDMDCAADIFDSLILGNLPRSSLFKNLTGFDWYYNYLQSQDEDFIAPLARFVQRNVNRRAIHVGSKAFNGIEKVKGFMKKDMMDTVAPWIEELLHHYTVCIYAGQLDIIVPYPLIRNFLNKLNFPCTDEYKKAPRRIWRVDGEIAGYIKQAGNLIEVLVRNAGHLTPLDQPKWVYELINHVTHNSD
ncbi:venom serine carboxypeptidase [Drosophila mojavensis]|uniref:Carboxypeptidase n=1 Tax=Drosophila mojavensis TaxID=7230 RepID=B4KNT4_DROMO|nr:venom serine carboxypeptidase [Drosophila mojavensis]EDW08979.1 uncharacterized protein Dmoj_GI19272 [Drosophila mojavensis]